MTIKKKSALKKYNSICDEFILPPQLKKFNRNMNAKSMALAADMSTIKLNSKHPSEFRYIALFYLSDRPAIVSTFKNQSADEVAQRFTVMTIVEQEFRICLHETNISFDDVDLNMGDKLSNGQMELGIGFKKSVPNKKAQAFHKLFDERLKKILHCESTVSRNDLQNNDPNDISEYSDYIEGLDIDDIRGEA
jgi:hypothetical protein